MLVCTGTLCLYLILACTLCVLLGVSNSDAFLHRDARVVKDMATGKSKGYGFVSFFNKWVSRKYLAFGVIFWDFETS